MIKLNHTLIELELISHTPTYIEYNLNIFMFTKMVS